MDGIKVKSTREFLEAFPQFKKMPASYGLDFEGLVALKEAQNVGKQEMVRCNLDERFMLQKVEAPHCVKVLVEEPLFDEKTGQRLDAGPSVKIFNLPAWRMLKEQNFRIAQKVTIIHDPIKYREEMKARKEAGQPEHLIVSGVEVISKIADSLSEYAESTKAHSLSDADAKALKELRDENELLISQLAKEKKKFQDKLYADKVKAFDKNGEIKQKK